MLPKKFTATKNEDGNYTVEYDEMVWVEETNTYCKTHIIYPNCRIDITYYADCKQDNLWTITNI